MESPVGGLDMIPASRARLLSTLVFVTFVILTLIHLLSAVVNIAIWISLKISPQRRHECRFALHPQLLFNVAFGSGILAIFFGIAAAKPSFIAGHLNMTTFLGEFSQNLINSSLALQAFRRYLAVWQYRGSSEKAQNELQPLITVLWPIVIVCSFPTMFAFNVVERFTITGRFEMTVHTEKWAGLLAIINAIICIMLAVLYFVYLIRVSNKLENNDTSEKKSARVAGISQLLTGAVRVRTFLRIYVALALIGLVITVVTGVMTIWLCLVLEFALLWMLISIVDAISFFRSDSNISQEERCPPKEYMVEPAAQGQRDEETIELQETV